MKRRDFLKTGLAAGTLSLAGGCGNQPGSRREPSIGAPSEKGAGKGVPEFPYAEATIAQLQEGQTKGRLTARSLTEAYFARMDAVDSGGPHMAAVIERNPDAMQTADSLDRERREGRLRGPLHGIPILIKDNIATADRMETTAGSLALVGCKPSLDAAIVARLREAGAVILGKTNLSEWANFRSTRSTSGWSGRGGQTKNPYVLDRNPCGSSSGSGAAASANICAAAVGTETDGSIVAPSSICGIVGIKPTVGLVSRSGIIPISVSQDTAGPMARTVADAAALLMIMAGFDDRDPATHAHRGKALPSYTAFLDAKAMKGARIGVVRTMFGGNDHVVRGMEEAVAAIKKLGAEVIDPVEIPSLGKVDDPELQVLLHEFKAGINDYLKSLGAAARCKSLEQIISFNIVNRDREMPYFGQEILLKAQEKGPLTAKEYVDAAKLCRKLSMAEGIDAVMDKHKLDALAAPTTNPAYPTDWIHGDHYTGGTASTLPAVAGYPHITVPAGFVFGLPFGISFFGRAWSEHRLIGLAYAFEQATKMRKPPWFLPTVDYGPSRL
jgi:amidase